MAGDNQHYLPRLLLRGFLNGRPGEYAWEFRKGCAPEEKPIERIASDFRFYGNPGEKSPDARLTKREKRYGDILHRIRKAPRDLPIKISPGEKKHILDLITDTIIRTKRQQDILDDLTMEQFSPLLRSAFLTERVKDDPLYARLAHGVIEGLEKHMRSVVIKGAHSKAAGDPLPPTSKYHRYRNFTWSILVYPPGTFILGDFGPVVICGSEMIFNLAFSDEEEVRAILLPIAHDLLLVGKAPQEGSRQIPAAETINVAVAELSREFFVSNQYGPREAKYFENLGRRANEEIG